MTKSSELVNDYYMPDLSDSNTINGAMYHRLHLISIHPDLDYIQGKMMATDIKGWCNVQVRLHDILKHMPDEIKKQTEQAADSFVLPPSNKIWQQSA